MNITKVEVQGQPLSYRLENDNGMVVEICTVGATMSRVELPDRRESDSDKEPGRVNVCLDFADRKDCYSNGLYAGATVAPVAGRIAGSRFAIGNRIYPLTANEGRNCLHSGKVSAAFLDWTVIQSYALDGVACLGLTIVLPEDLEGFPGNRISTATYKLDNRNCLTVDYSATSDRDTYVDMTNHAYFNMSGDFSKSARSQKLTIAAPFYMQASEENLPAGLKAVDGTAFDFRDGRVIEDVLGEFPDDIETIRAKGYDHAFDVRKAAAAGDVLLSLCDEVSGRCLKIRSKTGSVMVVYAGGYIGDEYALADGVTSSSGCAVALECQNFPNAINMPELGPKILKAGESYRHSIEYEFIF